MSLLINYKSGQGYWTRVMSEIAFATIALAMVAWIVKVLNGNQSEYRIYIQATVATVLVVLCGALYFWIFSKPRVVDFFIATDAELKKVNWPSKKDIIGSTWIVICGTFLMVAMLFIVDIAFAAFFQWIGVLES